MNEVIVAPSVLAADYMNLEKDMKLIETSPAKYVHIDIMDGSFVPAIAYGADWIPGFKKVSKDLVMDVHLMAVNPENKIPSLIEAGADIIGIHVEATPHIHRALQMIKAAGIKAEVVLNPGTPVSMIEPVLGLVDQVLVMTVNPGFGGQKFLPETLSKISQIRAIEKLNGYSFDIEVDGGINSDTAKLANEAGANVFVAGSYVFGSDDPMKAIESIYALNENN
ncbi:MAG: ribulose-phosphate 3-epimerase [Lactobacillaceae bacterium]|jgi:ribulose-phosphate 3-epimerase|nr:ribulose-phosphate 3-epimerase [Lactobacillaceae bacterium]